MPPAASKVILLHILPCLPCLRVGASWSHPAAPAFPAQVEAAAGYGAQQVLYTLNPTPTPFSEDAVIDECGAMNIFFVLEKVRRGTGAGGLGAGAEHCWAPVGCSMQAGGEATVGF